MITLGLLRGKRRPMSLILPLTKTARKHRRYERPLRSLSRSIALLRPTGTGAFRPLPSVPSNVALPNPTAAAQLEPTVLVLMPRRYGPAALRK